MSMSDCTKCWSTPCECGHDYESWSIERLHDQVTMLQRILDKKRSEQDLPTERTPARLYALAKKLYPKGLYGETCLPIKVEGQTLVLRCFPVEQESRHGGAAIDFALFPPEAQYARLRIAVWPDGRFAENHCKYVPPSDKVDKEPTFSKSVEETLMVILDKFEYVHNVSLRSAAESAG
jgi:hypothetical protein